VVVLDESDVVRHGVFLKGIEACDSKARAGLQASGVVSLPKTRFPLVANGEDQDGFFPGFKTVEGDDPDPAGKHFFDFLTTPETFTLQDTQPNPSQQPPSSPPPL